MAVRCLTVRTMSIVMAISAADLVVYSLGEAVLHVLYTCMFRVVCRRLAGRWHKSQH